MAAVVRVKRRIDEEPLSAFIINCKKPKLDESVPESLVPTKEEVSTIVKFAGTLESQDEEATLQIAKLTKDEAKQLATKVHKYPSAQERSRQQMRDRTHENRFKVVNCYRAIENNQNAANVSQEITIVDVEKQQIEPSSSDSSQLIADTPSSSQQASPCTTSAADTEAARETTTNYVYDLYLADETDQPCMEDTNLTDNYFSVRPYVNMVFEDFNDDTDDYDSEDSNRECYFKNEYPDTEEEDDDDNDSIGMNDMRRAINNVDLDGHYELSSDDDEEHYRNGFVYSIDSEAIGFEDDIDYCDVNRYGETYARYGRISHRNREAIYNDNESDLSDVLKDSGDEQ